MMVGVQNAQKAPMFFRLIELFFLMLRTSREEWRA